MANFNNDSEVMQEEDLLTPGQELAAFFEAELPREIYLQLVLIVHKLYSRLISKSEFRFKLVETLWGYHHVIEKFNIILFQQGVFVYEDGIIGFFFWNENSIIWTGPRTFAVDNAQ